MPYKVGMSAKCPASKPWACLKESTGEVMGCHGTKDAALAQVAALYASEGMMSKQQHRIRDVEMRAVQDDGRHVVTLHAVRPDVVDDYGSVWMADAFDASLEARLPTLCWAHDWSEPLGPGIGYRASADGPEIDFALSDFDAVPMARRAFAQIQDHTIRDCSVGFTNTQRRHPTDEERERWPGVREVIERATLDEVSLVLAGAVPGASVVGARVSVRSRDGSRREVPVEFAINLGRMVAAGELTHAEADATLALVAGVPPQASTPKPDDSGIIQAADDVMASFGL